MCSIGFRSLTLSMMEAALKHDAAKPRKQKLRIKRKS
jgi:hypothetical protein